VFPWQKVGWTDPGSCYLLDRIIKILDRDLLSGNHNPGFVRPSKCLGFEEKFEGVFIILFQITASKRNAAKVFSIVGQDSSLEAFMASCEVDVSAKLW